jgi:hypothetical protein
MKKGGATCSGCGAGFQRLEISTQPSTQGEYRCPACDELLEKFDGSTLVAYRLTIQPSTNSLKDKMGPPAV